MSQFAPHFLANRPRLRDRLNAFVVFTGIALGGVAGVEMVLGGGFDAITPSFAYEAPAPRQWFDRPVAPDLGWLTQPYSIQTAVAQTSFTPSESYPLEAYQVTATSNDLDGGADDQAAPPQQPAGMLRTSDLTPMETQAPDPRPAAAYSENDAIMAQVEAMMAQALDDKSYSADSPITPDLAQQAYETASPL